MANPEHVDILNQGVEVWNEWRLDNQEKWLDLSGADFSNDELTDANLRGVDLTGADLAGANLSDAIRLCCENYFQAPKYFERLSLSGDPE